MRDEGAADMKIETRQSGSTVIVVPSGRLDGIGAPDVEDQLVAAAKRHRGCVVLDCRAIVYISSAGLRALLLGAKACAREGGELTVAALQPNCRTVMEASGLLSVLQYTETVEATSKGARRPRRRPVRDAMEVGERREAHAVVLSPVGQLDSDSAPLLLKRIGDAIESGDTRVVLDCAGVSYVNSAGLRALLIGAKQCRKAGGNLVIAALAPQCRSVMEMSGFLTIIDYWETSEAAVVALASE